MAPSFSTQPSRSENVAVNLDLKPDAVRQAQVADGAPAVVITGAQALLEAELPGGLGIDEIDRTGHGVAAVQGALRAAQDFHALQIGQIRQQPGRSRRIHAVVVQADGRVLGDHDGIGIADTANEDRQVVAGSWIGGHLQIGRRHADILRIDQPHVLDLPRH